MISENLLLDYGATLLDLSENELVFTEGKKANFFFQLKTGAIKMYNLNEQGKEFVQGMFGDGESFGEPPMFGGFEYPASAITIRKSILYKVPKDSFFSLLKDNFDFHLKLSAALSKRLAYKSMILKEISGHPPEHRILTLVDFLKEKDGTSSKYQVDLTRQQIADLTGLRVETVIRGFKQLEVEGEIEIINRKVYR